MVPGLSFAGEDKCTTLAESIALEKTKDIMETKLEVVMSKCNAMSDGNMDWYACDVWLTMDNMFNIELKLNLDEKCTMEINVN